MQYHGSYSVLHVWQHENTKCQLKVLRSDSIYSDYHMARDGNWM